MKPKDFIYAMLHKPIGYECSHSPSCHPSVFDFFPPELLKEGLQCAGRLDFDTSGLLLFSNDGNFIHRIESPKKGFTKTYIAKLAEPLSEVAQKKLLEGVELKGEKRPCKAESLLLINEKEAEISIKGGKYHQVKRMFAAVGNKVEGLHRNRIGIYALDKDLKSGEWKFIEPLNL